MTKILFICLGNICRSPMAEFIFNDMAQKAGRSDLHADSCATSDEEHGNDVYPPAKACLRVHGVPFARRHARQFTKADYAAYDVIVVMEPHQVGQVTRMAGGDPLGKISLLLEHAGEHRAVADPWYTGDFEVAYEDICRGCKALLEKL